MELREIPSYPGYLAGADGFIYSVVRKKMRKLGARKSWSPGYLCTTMKNPKSPGKFKTVNIHVLICEAFHGKRPVGLIVRHLDGDRKNNLPSNLKWGTWVENHRDARDHGRLGNGLKSPNHFFKSKREIEHAMALIATGLSQKNIAALLGCNRVTILNLNRAAFYKKEISLTMRAP